MFGYSGNNNGYGASYMGFTPNFMGRIGSSMTGMFYGTQDFVTINSNNNVGSLGTQLPTLLLLFIVPIHKPLTNVTSSTTTNKLLSSKAQIGEKPKNKLLTSKTSTYGTSTRKMKADKTLVDELLISNLSLSETYVDKSAEGKKADGKSVGKHTNYGTKEKAVAEYIKDEFSDYDYEWVCGKSVGISGCRPDNLLVLPKYNIVVETDENQHSSYNDEEESHRMKQIHKDLGCKNIVFIRFNPDSYINVKGERISSCWRQIKSGIIKVSKPSEWPTRLKTLNTNITYWLNNKPTKPITIVKLYYDGYK